MSLLDAPVHTVLVWPEVASTDAEGNPVRVPAASPLQVLCSVHDVASKETTTAGDSVRTRRRLWARRFPAGPYARLEWAGRTYDVDGEPRRFNRTEAMAHVEVDLIARDPDVLPIGG